MWSGLTSGGTRYTSRYRPRRWNGRSTWRPSSYRGQHTSRALRGRHTRRSLAGGEDDVVHETLCVCRDTCSAARCQPGSSWILESEFARDHTGLCAHLCSCDRFGKAPCVGSHVTPCRSSRGPRACFSTLLPESFEQLLKGSTKALDIVGASQTRPALLDAPAGRNADGANGLSLRRQEDESRSSISRIGSSLDVASVLQLFDGLRHRLLPHAGQMSEFADLDPLFRDEWEHVCVRGAKIDEARRAEGGVHVLGPVLIQEPKQQAEKRAGRMLVHSRQLPVFLLHFGQGPVHYTVEEASVKRTIDVLGSAMSYQETGMGTPLIFLHGNPTSSYLWRKVTARMSDLLDGQARLIAPDLIGMGDSGKPRIDYRFADHARYLDAWFDALGLDSVVLIGHDWGAALAFDWAARHAERVRGIAFMEAIVRPMSWDAFQDRTREVFEAFRAPGRGEALILDQNVFIEQALPSLVTSGLADEDLNEYRRPYPTRDARKPLLQWPRELPLDGEPADVVARVQAFDRWLSRSVGTPKLLLAFDGGPGLITTAEVIAWCEATIADLEVEHCGYAGHHAPEDQPDAIASAIAAWVKQHRLLDGTARSEPLTGPHDRARDPRSDARR